MGSSPRDRYAERAALRWLAGVLAVLVVSIGLCSGFVYWLFG